MLPDLHTDFSRGRSGGLVFHLLKNFPVYCDPPSQRLIVNKAEIDVFLKLPCFFHDPENVGILISCSSAFSKTSLNMWKFTIHVLLKPGLENFKHYFTSVWDVCNCAVVWAFFCIIRNLQCEIFLQLHINPFYDMPCFNQSPIVCVSWFQYFAIMSCYE